MTPFQELAHALRDQRPSIKTINGQSRLMLTLSERETVEVTKSHGPFYTIEGVYADDSGHVATTPLGAVYGIALIPALIREYSSIRKQWELK